PERVEPGTLAHGCGHGDHLAEPRRVPGEREEEAELHGAPILPRTAPPRQGVVASNRVARPAAPHAVRVASRHGLTYVQPYAKDTRYRTGNRPPPGCCGRTAARAPVSPAGDHHPARPSRCDHDQPGVVRALGE